MKNSKKNKNSNNNNKGVQTSLLGWIKRGVPSTTTPSTKKRPKLEHKTSSNAERSSSTSSSSTTTTTTTTTKTTKQHIIVNKDGREDQVEVKNEGTGSSSSSSTIVAAEASAAGRNKRHNNNDETPSLPSPSSSSSSSSTTTTINASHDTRDDINSNTTPSSNRINSVRGTQDDDCHNDDRCDDDGSNDIEIRKNDDSSEIQIRDESNNNNDVRDDINDGRNDDTAATIDRTINEKGGNADDDVEEEEEEEQDGDLFFFDEDSAFYYHTLDESTSSNTSTKIESFDPSTFDITKIPPDFILQMSVRANNQYVREKTKPYAKRIFDIFNKNNCINHSPAGDYTKAFQDSASKCGDDGAGRKRFIYWKKDKGVGFTGNLPKRNENYEKKEGVEPDLHILARIDADTNMKMDEECREVVFEYVDDQISDKRVPFHLRQWFVTIRDRGGDDVGLIGQVVCQVLEIGCSLVFDSPRMMEFIAADERVLRIRHGLVGHASNAIVAKLPKKHYNKIVRLLASWMHGFDEIPGILSTKPCINDALVGKKNWKDTLPFPPVPNPKTCEEAYDCKKYTASQKAGGRQVAFEFIRDCIENESFTVVDRNNDPLFPVDHLAEVLDERFDFVMVQSVFGDDLRLYVHENGASILLNKSFSVGGESRFAQMMRACLRNMSIAVVQTVIRKVRDGLPQLPFETKFGCFLNASFQYELSYVGYHQYLLISACLHRDRVTDEAVSAIDRSRLQKATVSALFFNNRNVQKGHEHAKGQRGERLIEKSIVWKGRNILSRAKACDNLEPFIEAVNEIFGLDTSGSTSNSRWANLLQGFKDAGTPESIHFHSLLTTARDGMLNNTGNRSIHNSVPKPRVVQNRDSFKEKVKEILDTRSREYWIRPKGSATATVEVPIFEDENENRPVIDFLTKAGMAQKLQTMRGNRQRAGNTNAESNMTLEEFLPDQYKNQNKDIMVSKTNTFFTDQNNIQWQVHKLSIKDRKPPTQS